MKTAETPERNFEMTLEIDAPVVDVWKALTDSVELTRWFPTQAEVKPGLGGSIFLAWGEGGCGGTAPITAWEPNRRFQWTETMPLPGKPNEPPVAITIDYYLEGKGGKTVLRLVQSGFTADSAWDGYLDSITRGWKFELRGLRHYLTHHRGKDRRVLWVRQPITIPRDEVAQRVLGSEGGILRGAIEKLGENDPYRLDFVGQTGRSLEGVVRVNGLPRSFAATVANLNQSYLRFEIENMGAGDEAWLWLSTYGLDLAVFEEIQRLWTAGLAKAV